MLHRQIRSVRLRVEPHCACAFLYDGWLRPQLIAQTSRAVESASTSKDGALARLGVDAKAQAQALDAAIVDLAKTMPVEGTRMFVEIADSLVHLDVALGDFADHTDRQLHAVAAACVSELLADAADHEIRWQLQSDERHLMICAIARPLMEAIATCTG